MWRNQWVSAIVWEHCGVFWMQLYWRVHSGHRRKKLYRYKVFCLACVVHVNCIKKHYAANVPCDGACSFGCAVVNNMETCYCPLGFQLDIPGGTQCIGLCLVKLICCIIILPRGVAAGRSNNYYHQGHNNKRREGIQTVKYQNSNVWTDECACNAKRNFL